MGPRSVGRHDEMVSAKDGAQATIGFDGVLTVPDMDVGVSGILAAMADRSQMLDYEIVISPKPS